LAVHAELQSEHFTRVRECGREIAVTDAALE
jgi:hypothetical protein